MTEAVIETLRVVDNAAAVVLVTGVLGAGIAALVLVVALFSIVLVVCLWNVVSWGTGGKFAGREPLILSPLLILLSVGCLAASFACQSPSLLLAGAVGYVAGMKWLQYHIAKGKP